MTDLWLHVNTFFIIVLIFFRYSSYIKKYMTAYFICLHKLQFCGDNAIKFAKWFLFVFLPGTVKPAPAKLCTVFLCTLLNRLRFSPQNVGFGTKSTLSAAGSPSQVGHPFRLLPLVAATFPKGTAFGGGGKACSIAQRRPLGGAGTAQAVPEGGSAHPTREKRVQKRPQAFLYPKI